MKPKPTPPSSTCGKNYSDGGAHTTQIIDGVVCCPSCKQPISRHTPSSSTDVSDCCKAEVKAVSAYEGTRYYLCTGCKQPCDISTPNPMSSSSSSDEIDKQIIRIKQAYTEAHQRLGGSDESTIQQRWKLEAEIIAEAKAEIIEESDRRVLDWRIEQWRRGKKYMLNETWQPVFDELCELAAELKGDNRE